MAARRGVELMSWWLWWLGNEAVDKADFGKGNRHSGTGFPPGGRLSRSEVRHVELRDSWPPLPHRQAGRKLPGQSVQRRIGGNLRGGLAAGVKDGRGTAAAQKPTQFPS